MIELDDKFLASERGNTWLCDDDGNHVAWFSVGEGVYLEVSVTPDNYPGIYVAVIRRTEEDLAQHIREYCEGWFVKRCNIAGVKLDSASCVIGEEEN